MQRHSRLLAETLANRKEVELVVIHPHPQQVFEPKLGIREISLEGINTKKFYLAECYRYSKRVFKAIQSEYPEAIIYSQGLSVWYGIKQLRNRLIINPHGLEAYQVSSLKEQLFAIPFRAVFNYLFAQTGYLVSLGGKLSSILKSRMGKKTELLVLPNGVLPKEKPESTKPEEMPFQFLFVSRFATNKGIGTLFEAIELLKQKGLASKIEFHFVGKGPLFEHYQKNNPYSNCFLHGFLSDEDLELAYQNCDLFVLPTWFEGMPTVVLEAMSYGKPVIVSDVGASAELVDAKNGYLLQARDSKQLAEAMENFMQLSPEAKTQLGQNSYEKVLKNFTWDKIAERHEQAFHSIAKKLAGS